MVRAESLFVDGQGASIERLGFVQPICGMEQPRQIAQVAGDLRMVRAKALLINGQGAPIERFGFRSSNR
jgi:hypothetical protein